LGFRPVVLLAVIVIAAPVLLSGSASAFVVSAAPVVSTPAGLAHAAAGSAAPKTVPFLQKILNGPIPVSGIVSAGPLPAYLAPSHLAQSPSVPRPLYAPGLGVLAPVATALIYPIGAEYRVTNNAGAQNEISLAVNPTNPLNIVASANDYRGGDGWCGVYSTHDGGRTWIEQLIPHLGDLLTLQASGDPGVAFDGNGVVYQSCLAFNRSGAPGNVIAVTKSLDGGVTWGTPVTVANTTAGVFHDKDYIAVDASRTSTRGNIYVTWTRFMAGAECGGGTIAPIYFSRSTDGGLTWSTEKDITGNGYRCDQGSEPSVGPGGELYVSWLSYLGGERAVIERSTDAGQTWGPIVTVSGVTDTGDLFGPAPRTPDFPSFAVNPVDAPTGNRLHMVWADSRSGQANILMSTSSNGGTTWSLPMLVNDLSPSMNIHFFAWVSASQNGRVDIEFYGGSNTPGNVFISDWVASSFDFGATIAFNLPASPAFDPGNWFIGDYNNIASFGSFAYPGFCDLRNTPNEEAYMAGPPMLFPALGGGLYIP
jgi:hypothetical protein